VKPARLHPFQQPMELLGAQAPSAAPPMRVTPLPMHRAAAVRQGYATAGGPDFLARLEKVEGKDVAATTGVDTFSGPARSRAGSTKASGPVPSSDHVMEQLRQMETQIDELRTKKRESTPPEKHVGDSTSMDS